MKLQTMRAAGLLSITAAIALGGAGVAQASQGADNPVGQHQSQGTDDPAGQHQEHANGERNHHNNGRDRGHGRQRGHGHNDGPGHHRHGNDHGPNHH